MFWYGGSLVRLSKATSMASTQRNASARQMHNLTPNLVYAQAQGGARQSAAAR